MRELRVAPLSARGGRPRICTHGRDVRPDTALTLRAGEGPGMTRMFCFGELRFMRLWAQGSVRRGRGTRSGTGEEVVQRLVILSAPEREFHERETYIEPDVVSFLRWRSELHLAMRRGHNNAVLIDTRWHWVGIHDRPYRFDVRCTTCHQSSNSDKSQDHTYHS